MTDQQKHAARLRYVTEYADPESKAALLAGAEALEAQGRWYFTTYGGKHYMVPVDQWREWGSFLASAEPGEHTAIVPAYAVEVSRRVVITGWVR